MRLTKSMRENWARVLAAPALEKLKEHEVKTQELVLAWRARTFPGIDDLPEGWLPTYMSWWVSFGLSVRFDRPYSFPVCAGSSQSSSEPEIREAGAQWQRLQEDTRKVLRTFERMLQQFNTLKQLELGWPEGYAKLVKAKAIGTQEKPTERAAACVPVRLQEEANALLLALGGQDEQSE